MSVKAEDEFTTMSIKKSTKAELESLGKMGETYDDLVSRLVKEAKRREK